MGPGGACTPAVRPPGDLLVLEGQGEEQRGAPCVAPRAHLATVLRHLVARERQAQRVLELLLVEGARLALEEPAAELRGQGDSVTARLHPHPGHVAPRAQLDALAGA